MINNRVAPDADNSHQNFSALFGKIGRQFSVTIKEGDIEIVFDCIANDAYGAKVQAANAYPGCRVSDVCLQIIH